MEIISRSEAKDRGLKHYFTGKSCKNGHIDLRFCSTRQCRSCVASHSIAWRADPKNKEKIREVEKLRRERFPEEARQRTRRYYWKNRQERLEKSKQWRIDNKEKVSEYEKSYREKNRDKLRSNLKIWQQSNKEKINAYQREWRALNLEYARKRSRNYLRRKYREDKSFRATVAIRGWLRRSLRDGHTKGQYRSVGYDTNDLIRHLESLFEEGMSWDNHGDWHIDHITPINHFLKAGVYDPSIINSLSNLRPIWASDNLRRSKMPSDQDIATIMKTYGS